MKQQEFNPIIEVEDDGLTLPEDVGNWSEKKYRMVGHYCNLFTSAMKNKWPKLVYIDLFASAGHARIKNTNRILKTSSLIAMNLPNRFTHYILSEYDPSLHEALKERVERENPTFVHHVLNYDSNKHIADIKKLVPSFSKDSGTLSFCFVDPFSMNLHFNTIEQLSKGINVDFLILFAFQMDARRNLKYYLDPKQTKIDNFLGDPNWREKFQAIGGAKKDFIKFLADEYDKKMVALGYIAPEYKTEIKTDDGLSLYYLGFYSKHALGNEFFKKIRKLAEQQLTLDLDF